MQVSFEQLISLIRDLGFPIVIALILLVRFDKKLTRIAEGIYTLSYLIANGDRSRLARARLNGRSHQGKGAGEGE